MDTGGKTVPLKLTPQLNQSHPTNNEEQDIKDKYIIGSVFSENWCDKTSEIEEFLAQVKYFEMVRILL